MYPISRRSFSLLARRRYPFGPTPAPPRLPESEQKVFEDLQRSSTGAFSTPRSKPESEAQRQPKFKINQSPHNNETSENSATQLESRVKAAVDKEELHPDVRRGSRPEFEGERNPKTGEVGGPKNEPLRWGGEVDWSYNGRVTDF